MFLPLYHFVEITTALNKGINLTKDKNKNQSAHYMRVAVYIDDKPAHRLYCANCYNVHVTLPVQIYLIRPVPRFLLILQSEL